MVLSDLPQNRRGSMSRALVLGAGMLAGAALAVFFLVRVPERVSDDVAAVAWVNGRPIPRESYENALRAVASDRKGGTLREGDRERILDRLIDQELLIDRAIELGLHERDPQIRNQLATAMIDFLVRRAEDEASSADDAELVAFYEAERFRFERAARYRVVVEGESVPLPDGLLLRKEIEQRLGPSAAATIERLAVGESAVVGEGDRAVTVRLVDREGGEVAPFGEVREAVRSAFVRSRSEAAVREFLDLARQRSDIVLEPE